MPNVAFVAERWRKELETVVDTPYVGPDDAVEIGRMFEYLVGFDMSRTVPYRHLLRYLRPEACTALLMNVGFRRTRPCNKVSAPPPDLDGWARTQAEPLDPSAMVATLWHLAKIESFLFTASSARDVIAQHGADDLMSPISDGTRGLLLELWESYQASGRAGLLNLGDPVDVRPEFHPERGVGDLVIGHTLVDIKAKTNPCNDLDTYVVQLLKYVLFDEQDRYSIDEIALYFGYQPALVTQTLSPEALLELSDGQANNLAALRHEFARIRPA